MEELSITDGRTTGKITASRRAKTDHIVLRDWLFQHRYNAYPTRAETLILATKTELTTKQVRTWFINARRRILPEIIRQEGREPEKFIRTRTCFSFFCSTTVTDPTSSTPFSSCPSWLPYSTYLYLDFHLLSRRWQLNKGGSKMFKPLLHAGMSVFEQFFLQNIHVDWLKRS